MGQQALQGYNYAHINANGTFNLVGAIAKAGAGLLGLFAGIVINTPGSVWTLTVYDGPNGTGNVVGLITPSQYAPPSNLPLQMLLGLSVVAAGTTAGSATVAYL